MTHWIDNNKWYVGMVVAVALAVGGSCVGCGPEQANMKRAGAGQSRDANLSPDQVARLLETNVVAVATLYDPWSPWIWTESKSRVRGIRINALYLFGPDNKGIFGDGVIRPKLYVGRRDQKGKIKWPDEPTKEWSFTVEEAIPFRAKKPTSIGWGYGLYLDWGDLDFSREHIRMVVSFERADQAVFSSSVKDMRVPARQ